MPRGQQFEIHFSCPNTLVNYKDTVPQQIEAWAKWETLYTMITLSNGNIFRVTSPLCGEISGPRWIPCKKASDAELWCFYLICTRINGSVNNREAGDLRRHRSHYDVIVMPIQNSFLLIEKVWIAIINSLKCVAKWPFDDRPALYQILDRSH